MIDMDETYESLENPDHPDDGDEDTERVEERGRRRWPIVMVALVVVAAAVAGVVWGVNERHDVNELRRASTARRTPSWSRADSSKRS